MVISVSFLELETKEVFFTSGKHRDAPSGYHITCLAVV